MHRLDLRRLLALATLAALVAVALVLGVARTSAPSSGASARAATEEGPPALAAHLEKLKEALPGNAGESEQGRGTAEDQEFEALAYPADDVSAAKLDAARLAASRVSSRFPKGNGRGGWVTVGPKNALYPASPFRSIASYVPNAYYAGGRTTALAISPACRPGSCRMWMSPAGGGVWRTDNALGDEPKWTYLGGPLGINAVGSLALDPANPSTLYVGTGEANASGDSAAGVGIYKSTDGGTTWTGPLGSSVFRNRSVGSIAVGPAGVLYAATTRGVRGVASVSGGAVSLIPGAAQWGLYKSTDGGASWTFVHNGAASTACGTLTAQANNADPCSPRGVRRVALDPTAPSTVYASSYARGVWRSSDGGGTWTQIKQPLTSTATTDRAEFAVTTLPGGATRMYVAEGASGSPTSRVFRSDDVATGAPVFTSLTSSDPVDPGWATFNYCTGQCWYDNFVSTPAGSPDVVYVGGSYQYGELTANHRAVVLSRDGGTTWTDMTADGTDPVNPNALHPDQHALVTNPSNPLQFFEANDGGVMRSSGVLVDRSSWCAARGLSAVRTARCEQMLSAIPSLLVGLNKGVTTLQFQSLSVSPFDANELQGGTQDNGTWENYGSPSTWVNTMIGDGGQSGFDVGNPAFRFHTFFDASPDVNFSSGDMADWNWIADPIYGTGGLFYVPIISDPKVGGTMFVGTRNALRTKTSGMGSMSLAEFRKQCNEWTGLFQVQCGDWEAIAAPSLTSSQRGDRAGGAVTAIERTPADTSTAWASTQTGRLFVSKDVDAEPASAVTWTRLDTALTPNRHISSIYVDPANANVAYVSYMGFDASTPSTPGHVFRVTFDPQAGTAAFQNLSLDLGDLPINDLVLDAPTGDLYASSDFGVHLLARGSSSWTAAATGMPNVEVSGLTIATGKRKLYAATHGLGAWALNLP